MTGPWIAVVGDRRPHYRAQDEIEPSLHHSAVALGIDPPEVRWIGTDVIDREGVSVLDGTVGVWCAPGSPYESMDGAIAAIRVAREGGLPFIGTCAGFQHGVIEFARHVLGRPGAAHAEYGAAAPDDLFIDELACSLVGQALEIDLVDAELAAWYGTRRATEQYYCRFGLDPRRREPLHDAGLRIAGVDAADGEVRVLRLDGHPFFVLTLFVPQSGSTAGEPHPLVSAFLRSCVSGARRPLPPTAGSA